MKLKVGTYEWPVNGVKVTSDRLIERDKAGEPFSFTDIINADGYIEAEGQTALTTAQNEMMRELLIPFRDILFLCDDGSNSATVLTQRNSITGVVVTDGPHFRDVVGPEYVSRRHFTFKAEADYYYPGRLPRDILEWRETVSISGGGPLYLVKPALSGPPQRQLLVEQTPCVATQSGFAVGFRDYPAVPGAIWPFALKQKPQINRQDPDKKGQRNYIRYRIEWSYSYEWTGRLEGVPTLWR